MLLYTILQYQKKIKMLVVYIFQIMTFKTKSNSDCVLGSFRNGNKPSAASLSYLTSLPVLRGVAQCKSESRSKFFRFNAVLYICDINITQKVQCVLL